VKYTLLISALWLMIILSTEAQENPKEFVHNPHSSLRIVNSKTPSTIAKRSFVLNIQHRFGQADLSNELVKHFFGLDKSSNIRFAFGIPVTNRLYVGLGRTKTDKVVDLEGNYTFYKQTKSNQQPVTLALHSNLGVQTDDFPVPDNNWVNEDSTRFKYQFNHRLSYYNQLTIARRFNNWLYLQAAPFYVFRNLAPIERDNYTAGITFGGRFTVGLSSSILFEYTQMLDKTGMNVHPFALAYEIGTAGHSFQITISTNQSLINQYVNYASHSNITDGLFYLGFNIYRTFYLQP